LYKKGFKICPFGRNFSETTSLEGPPYYGVKVTGALFHTQGGLSINKDGRVLRKNGTKFPNLFAVGGSAVGVSGGKVEGYLSGNGLLTAVALGFVAGKSAARLVAGPQN
jgi:fumarate reductase flavoprotein subunit